MKKKRYLICLWSTKNYNLILEEYKENYLKNNKNLFIAGTRPEIVKISPLINRLNASILLTGQHHKKEMLNNFMDLVDTEEIYDLQPEEFRNFNNEIL